MYLAMTIDCVLAKPVEVIEVIGRLEKTGLLVIASLDDVHWNIG
jgi:hypothetical protein